MASEKVQVANITLIKQGRVPGIAEVKCPSCGAKNSFKVKSYLGPTGTEMQECSTCSAQIAFAWRKESL